VRKEIKALVAALAAVLVAAMARAQAAGASSADASDTKEATPSRPLEGRLIIDLPSVEVASPGTLTFLITHRFGNPVQGSSIHNFYSILDRADIGLGLSYVPLRNLDISFYRSTELEVYEVAAKYRAYSSGLFDAALRVGGDWRTAVGIQNRSSFFAQGVLALSLGSRVRISAVPTYLSRTSAGLRPFVEAPAHDPSCVTPVPPRTLFLCSGLYDRIFNVPVAVSLAVTRSIIVHGEVTPRYGRADSLGTGWAVSVEKTVLRHRFSFTAGNQRETTVDRYTAPLLPDALFGARSIYLGFNITRDWKMTSQH
jgi:hypothetical protein